MMRMEQNTSPSGSNPYDFILNDPPKKKRSVLPSGGSKKQRTILMAVGGIFLLIFFYMLFSIIMNSGTSNTERMTSVAQEQEEIIRVASLGERGARSTSTQSLALNVRLSVTSSQQKVLAYLNERNVELKDKDLALKANSKTDAVLKEATDNGRFDETFNTIFVAQLKDYQKNLATGYDESGNKTVKQILQEAYAQIKSLLPATEDSTSSTN